MLKDIGMQIQCPKMNIARSVNKDYENGVTYGSKKYPKTAATLMSQKYVF